MSSPVLILTRNCLELTKRCVESVLCQDIPTKVCIVDNGSTDGTAEWSIKSGYRWVSYNHNAGVSKAWNMGLQLLLEDFPQPHVLVVGNDTILARWTYSALLSADVPFVTGVDVDMDPLPQKPDVFPLSPHPDLSCFLIRREFWEKVGPFDERMVMYVQDCDMHVRAHRLGIPMWKASVPYNHERSSTLKNADPEERAKIQEQANKDRAVFKSIYGCVPGTKEYEALFL